MTLADFSLLWSTAQASPSYVVVKSPDPHAFIAGLHLIAAKGVGLEELESIALRELRAAWTEYCSIDNSELHPDEVARRTDELMVRISPILEEL